MDMRINRFTIHAVVPVMRNGKPDSYYIAGVREDDREAVCAHTYDLSKDHWAQGYYFPVGPHGDLDKALEEAIKVAYEEAGVLPDEAERLSLGVRASSL